MTALLATSASLPAPANGRPADTASAKSGDKARFDQAIDTAQADDTASAPDEGEASKVTAQAAVADKSLEALLQSLRATLLPGVGPLLPPAAKGKKEASEGATAKAKSDDAKGDDVIATLPLLNLALPQSPAAAAGTGADATLGIAGTAEKPGHGANALADLLAPPPLAGPQLASADFRALTEISSVPAADPAALPAAVERMVDTARDAAWLDRLSRDIAESAGAGDRVRFRMLPPSLGALDVSVERQASGLSVSMTTHTPEARNLIADARQQMVDGLKAQGVPLVQFSLTTAGEDRAGHRPPTFFNHLIEVAAPAGTDLAAQPVAIAAERMGRFA